MQLLPLGVKPFGHCDEGGNEGGDERLKASSFTGAASGAVLSAGAAGAMAVFEE